MGRLRWDGWRRARLLGVTADFEARDSLTETIDRMPGDRISASVLVEQRISRYTIDGGRLGEHAVEPIVK